MKPEYPRDPSEAVHGPTALHPRPLAQGEVADVGALPPVSTPALLDKRRSSWNWLLNVTTEMPLPEVQRAEVSLWRRLLQASTDLLEDVAQIQVMRGQALILNRPALAFARDGQVGEPTIQLSGQLAAGDRLKVTMTMPEAGALVVLQREGDSVSLVYPPSEAYAVARNKDEQVILPGKLQGEPGEEQALAILVVELELARLLAGKPADEVVSRLESCPGLRMRTYQWRLH